MRLADWTSSPWALPAAVVAGAAATGLVIYVATRGRPTPESTARTFYAQHGDVPVLAAPVPGAPVVLRLERGAPVVVGAAEGAYYPMVRETVLESGARFSRVLGYVAVTDLGQAPPPRILWPWVLGAVALGAAGYGAWRIKKKVDVTKQTIYREVLPALIGPGLAQAAEKTGA